MADTRVEPLRLVIVGKTGVGKSQVGNTILGKTEFLSKASAKSVTKGCQKAQDTIGIRRIEVVDTPGIMDTGRRPEVVAREILRCIDESKPGPHAFLLVLQVTRFTEEEQKAVKALKEIFGRRVADYMIVVFNRADELGNQTIHDYVKGGTPELRKVISECGERYVPFNKDPNNRRQVADLVKMVDQMIVVNGGGHFSNEVYEDSKRESNPESFMSRWLSNMTTRVRNMFRELAGLTSETCTCL